MRLTFPFPRAAALVLFLSTLATCPAAGQLSLQTYYNFGSGDELTTVPDVETRSLDGGLEFGLGYWFRLPNHRVEFVPSLSYFRSESLGREFAELGLHLRTNLYVFDFTGDCDCPTFGKQGPQLQKGFFIQVAPGYQLSRREGGFFGNQYQGYVGLGLGLGLDIGVSNFMTLTPFAGYRHQFGRLGERRFIDQNGNDIGTTEISYSRFQLGLTALLRFDADRY